MAKFKITPADSPDIQCEFEVPRKGKDPLVFSVPRVEYSDLDIKWAEWLGERMRKTTDEAGNEVTPDAISDREAVVEQLRIAGNLPKSICTQLYQLKIGQLNEIFENWTSASKVTVGESEPSDS